MTLCDSNIKVHTMDGQKEKFVRFDSDLASKKSFELEKKAANSYVVNFERFQLSPVSISSSFKRGFEKGSQGLRSIGQSLRFGSSKEVFSEDLKSSDKKILDPQDKFLQRWNKVFLISCIVAISVDPLFFYIPVIDGKAGCLTVDHNLEIIVTVLRTLTDLFYLMHMALQFRTAFIAPSSRVFGRGELVIDPIKITKRYLSTYFIVDLIAVLPFPQVVICIMIPRMRGSSALNTKNLLRFTVFFQYLPRFIRIFPLSAEVIKTTGVLTKTAWAGAAYNLLLYMLASHVIGACWYLFALERQDSCWRKACLKDSTKCSIPSLYCVDRDKSNAPSLVSKNYRDQYCNSTDTTNFDFGTYARALGTGIISSTKFLEKYLFCLWWGLQNLSSLGQNLQTSTYVGEIAFAMSIAIVGLVLFGLLIGNMQTYLQSLTIRLEEMRLKRRDTEQWMRHRLLPDNLQKRVRRYDHYKWLETRGVDEETLIQNLPKDLRRDIKRHLCLDLVRRVPLFDNMDEQLLDAMCERLKPSLYTEQTYILKEGDPVDEMLFIIRGHLESVTTNGGRTGFFNSGVLKQGDFCGEELLTWALVPKSGSNLPLSTRTVKALTEVEAFALRADDLKFVARQFRRLHSRQLQHTFRFYSQQWRTWAACFIQAAWRRYWKRKSEQNKRREESASHQTPYDNSAGTSPSLGVTILASRFAANALRGHRQRNSAVVPVSSSLIKLKKPAEPDFTAEDVE